MKALTINVNIPRFIALQVMGRLNRRSYYDSIFSTVKLADVPEPKLPNEDWLKLKVKLCGFCGSDLSLLCCRESPMAQPFTSFPCIFGHEVSAEVVQTGSRVQGFTRGDRVTLSPSLTCEPRGISPVCPSCASGNVAGCERCADGDFSPGMFSGICRDVGGGFAEYMVAHKSQVFRVPDAVSNEAATLTEPLAVGLQAVLDNRPKDSDKVLVIGGGVIGAMIVKAVRGLGIGCSITVAEPSSFSAEYVKKSGADHIVSGNIIDAAERITGAKAYKTAIGYRFVQGGFDRVFDTVGHSPTLQTALIVTRSKGLASLVGIAHRVSFDPTPLWLKLLTVKGCYASGYHDTENGRVHTFDLALGLMEKKKVVVEDMITHTFTIEGYKELIATNMNKVQHRAIKTAIRFD